jgi:hypothetical protein
MIIAFMVFLEIYGCANSIDLVSCENETALMEVGTIGHCVLADFAGVFKAVFPM